MEEMYREVDVVVNSAATTNFDERYDVSLDINTLGAKHVLTFAKKCEKIQVVVHVSTAYVSGERAGLIKEEPFYMGEALNGISGLDIDVELKIAADTLKDFRVKGLSDPEITLAMKNLGIARFYVSWLAFVTLWTCIHRKKKKRVSKIMLLLLVIFVYRQILLLYL